MWDAATFSGERFAVVGLGRNGLPAALALAAMGADVVGWDDGAAARDAARVAGVRVEQPDAARFGALVLSPGIPHKLPAPHPVAAAATAAGVPILSDAELLFEAARRNGSTAKFVGVTGTNGKSTTTALVAHALARSGVEVAAGGNLGTPALGLESSARVYVLEISSYMLERLRSLRFHAAAMLNITPDHLDRHGDMDGYVAAKRAIFARQEAGDHAVVGVDDPPSLATARWLLERPATVSMVSGADHVDGLGAAMRGAHNVQNASAARALLLALGMDAAAVACGMETFPGLPHRQESVATIDGVEFVNDSKATNADATASALAAFPRVVWIAGGMAKAGGIDALKPLLAHVAHAVLIGRDAETLAETLAECGVPYEVAGTLDRAVVAASRVAARDDVPTVLLSPACASFDQFSGFEARGEAFRAAVAGLA